jgi:penicillin amidase
MNIVRLLLRLALGRRLPVASGELRVSGLTAPITIRRDSWGVPHIDAQSDADASFALGFVQAQDRACQLEVLWRVGRGRLAEWVGPPGLEPDRMSRRIGFRRAGERQVAALSTGARSVMESFARGVNEAYRVGLSAKPHEFAILGGEPSAWDVADVLASLKLQSLLLPSNWDVEAARLRILRADGPDALTALDPVGTFPEAFTALQSKGLDSLAADLAAIHRVMPRGGGSNNWVIAGSLTASGRPLLCSDPHLAPTAPAPWYLAHVRTPEWEIAGACMGGTPGFAIAHNGRAAWGVTAGLTDNTDLFLETLGPDGRSVREADGSFTPCEVLRETIRVKGRPDVVEDVLVTPRGPIVSPLFGGMTDAVSMKAVWLEPLPVEGFVQVARSRSFDEFRHCFRHWPVLPLNVVYADAEGTIGWQLVGQIPRRKGLSGLVPQPADSPRAGWEADLVPFETMPHRVNPESGFIATANQSPTAEPDATFGFDFIDAYRARTIADEIAKRTEPWDAAACSALQMNKRSLPWEEMREVVLAVPATDPQTREAIDLLRAWDGHVSADSPAAAIYELFVAEMCVRIAREKAPASWQAALGESGLGAAGHNLFADRRVSHLVRLLREQPEWFRRPWHYVMADVLGDVVRKLRREVGPSPPFWAWGHLRQLRLEHHLFGKHWLLGRAFNLGPVPCPGDQNTIGQAAARPLHPTDFTHNMSNLRAVFDLADLSKSTFVLAGGQSGNPCSPHHADQFPLWQAGESFTIPWKQDDVIRGAKETLRLTS